MRHRRPALLLTLLLLTPGAAARARQHDASPAGGDPAARLRRRIDRLATHHSLGGGAKVGIVVADYHSGKLLYQRLADTLLPVASNVKLVTSAAALSELGPAFRLRTALFGRWPRGGVLPGDLYLKGYGDPTLAEGHLWRLASDLYQLGVRKIRGGVVIDASYFDSQRLAPLYASRTTDMWYRPASSAVSLNQNVLSVRVFAADRAGEAARVIVRPRSAYFTVQNQVLTVGRRRRTHLELKTSATRQGTRIEISGRVRVGYRGRWLRRRVEHPGRLAAITLRDALIRRGIQLGRKTIRDGQRPASLHRPLALRRSPPLAVIVRQMNKRSSNFTAEQLLKILGAERAGKPGSWAGGLSVVARYLERLGIARNAYSMKNGSGLYQGNKFTPRQLVTVIRSAARDFRIGPDYVASLAIAGVDGTLGRRFSGSGVERYVRAKTGTLSGVISLSGLASAENHRRAVFSIVIADLSTGRINRARKIADQIARAVVVYLRRSR